MDPLLCAHNVSGVSAHGRGLVVWIPVSPPTIWCAAWWRCSTRSVAACIGGARRGQYSTRDQSNRRASHRLSTRVTRSLSPQRSLNDIARHEKTGDTNMTITNVALSSALTALTVGAAVAAAPFAAAANIESSPVVAGPTAS